MLPFLLDFFFPRRSLTGSEGEWVTERECRQLRSHPVILERPRLRSLKLLFLDRVTAAAEYRGNPLLHRAVHTFKYRRVPALSEALCSLIVQASSMIDTESSLPVLCPVPLHWRRLFWRGFNQASLLAQAVGKERGWEAHDLLRRRRYTGTQVGRTREERLRGVHDAFCAAVNPVPSFIILVDDLSTTGATLNMCAKALKQAGANRVEGLVVAHG